MSKSSSANIHVPWEAVCAALRLPTTGKALPLRTRCPLCGQVALVLYHDISGGGHWHHCESCGSSGDLLELLCRAWRMEPADALASLAAETALPPGNLDPEQLKVRAQSVADRRRLAEFWQQAKADYPDWHGPAVRQIRLEHNLHLDAGPERWAAGPGKLLGAAGCRAIETALRPQTHFQAPLSLFRGKQWRDALVMPFYALPDRFAHFLCLGRQGRVPQDLVLAPADAGSEGGLAGIEGLSEEMPAIVGLDSWLLLLQLQLRHFNSALRPLPLVAWHDDGHRVTRDAWRMLSRRRVVLWTWRMDHRLIRQALETDAQICTLRPQRSDRTSVLQYLRHHQPEQLVQSILKRSAPWSTVLRGWLAQAPGEQILQLQHDMEQAEMDVSYIWRCCGQVFCRPRESCPVRQISWDRWRIAEQADSWYILERHRRREAVNASFRLTHLIRDKASGRSYYYGHIRCRGRRIDFLEEMEYLQAHAARWLQAKLLEAKAGVLVCHAGLRPHLHEIAVLFHEPQIVEDELWRWTRRLDGNQP